MRRGLSAIGIVMLVWLIGWIGYTLMSGSIMRDTPQRLDIGSAFEGIPQISPEDIRSVMSAAQDRVSEHNWYGNIYRGIAKGTAWLGFLFSSIITIVAGRSEVFVEPDPHKQSDVLKELKARNSRWKVVGIIAAFAAVCTALSGRAETEAALRYKNADDLRQEVSTARKEIVATKNSEEAQAILDRLRTFIER